MLILVDHNAPSIELITSSLQFFAGLNITADQKKFFKKALHTYYDAVTELLLSEHNVSLTRSSTR